MRYKIAPVMVYLSTKYLLIELERIFDVQGSDTAYGVSAIRLKSSTIRQECRREAQILCHNVIVINRFLDKGDKIIFLKN